MAKLKDINIENVILIKAINKNDNSYVNCFHIWKNNFELCIAPSVADSVPIFIIEDDEFELKENEQGGSIIECENWELHTFKAEPLNIKRVQNGNKNS